MRIVFMGTPEFAVTSLEALAKAAQHTLVGVVTQPGRPQGRGRVAAPSPVRNCGERLGLPVLEPSRLDAEFVARLTQLRPDLLAVVAYGKILPLSVLGCTRFGAVNVHPSLLPRHRGASPIQHAILSGDPETGVTTMLLNEAIDSGALLQQVRVAIGPDEDAVALSARLEALGATMLVETIDQVERGAIEPVPQDPAAASYAPKLRPEDAWIDWSQSAAEVGRRVRGLVPWPTAQTSLPNGKRLQLLAGRAEADDPLGAVDLPGTVIEASKRRLAIRCGAGLFLVGEAQIEGKRRATVADLVNGRQLPEGTRLGRQ